MANEMQRGNLTGTAIMRMPISGTVSIGGKQMKELRFMPYSEFPEEGREDVLYIDTDGNAMYYWDGTEYIALSGGGSGGTSNYNELSNKPSINDITLTGDKTSADLGLQPTISDLSTIRSGAASGATAVQPSDMETALASKQDVIDDLSDIRTGAAAGETAVQPFALETALSEKQDVISDLSDIRSGAAAGATALQPEDVDTLPTDGSSNPVSSGGTYNFVNSSIATNTAYFIGTFASVAELEAYSGTVTNNDYAFVTSTDSAGNTLYNRYKYNAATQIWSFEYAVNNTAFTTAQWAAIQSGMTSADKTKLDGIEQGANKTVIDESPTSGSSNAVSSGGVHTALSGKQDTISDLSDIRSGASAGATAVQPSALNDYQTKLSGTNKLDPSFIDYDASHRAVSDTEKSTWNGKQDEISDLSTIRSGAAAGATAVQPTDMNTALAAKQDTLTFDTVPTENSTNPVTSGGVAASQAEQDAEIAVIANAGAKNLLKITASSKTHKGVTFTVNDDQTVTVNGTNDGTGASTFVIVHNEQAITIPDGNYILSGCPTGGGASVPFDLRWYMYSPEKSAYDSGNGASVEKSGNGTGSNIAIVVKTGQTANNLTFKPMLRPASIADSTFVPYAPTNRELYETKTEQSETNVIANLGAKNNANFNFGGVVQDANVKPGTIACVESNGTFSFSGTSADKNYAAYVLKQFLLKAGAYKISGVSGGSNTTYWMRIGTGTADTGLFNLYDAEREFDLASDTLITVQVVIYKNQTVSNLVFKPMIRPASITDSTFVPYAKTNRELTVAEDEDRAALIGQVDDGAKNKLPITIQSQTVRTVPFTVNSDGSITANGTVTGGDAYLNLETSIGDKYVGMMLSGGTASLKICISKGGSGQIAVYSESSEGVAIPDNATNTLFLFAPNGTVLSNVTVKPMICTKAAWDVSHAYEPYSLPNPTLTPAAIKAVDDGAKNLLNLNTGFATYTNKGITYEDNSDGTIKVSGTSSSADSYITLYDRNTDNLFGIQKGETVVIRSTSDNVSVNLIYKKSGGGYGLTVYGYKSSPGWFTVPSDFAGFLLRIGVPRNGTTVNEDVGGMLCTASDYAVSPALVPYCPTNRELYETKVTMGNVYGFGTAIPSNSNLNDYKTPGVFRIESSSIATTISNLPTGAAAGRLEVKGLNTADRYLQIYYSEDVIFQRRWNGSSWFTWYKFEGTAVT